MIRIALVLLALAGTVHAQGFPVVYYDPATGDDANPGTKDKPFRTMEKAESALKGPGQIISPAGVTTYGGAVRFKVPQR